MPDHWEIRMFATEPPAARPLTLDRRMLLRSTAIGAGLVAMPLSAAAPQRGFSHGVASGEPGADSMLLWTRFVADQPVDLTWEIAPGMDFARVVASGSASASPDTDWCVRASATGLEPGRWYYYRFVAPDGGMSMTGRTRTLPVGPVERWRMATFSCSNIGFGWFNAYAHAAERDEFDLLLHLGDYYYEYPKGTYPDADAFQPGRVLAPEHEAVTLSDYRLRHADYRADPDLQRLLQLYPIVMVWDDHETANDSWEGGAENHQPDTEGPWDRRKSAALTAYREWLPVSDADWAQYEIGDLATLFRLETRLDARSQQFRLEDVLKGKTTPEAMMAALTAFRDDAYRDPSREMLGRDQLAWLADGMKASKDARKPWQVLVQQVIMGHLVTPAGFADALPAGVPDYVRQRVQAGALAAQAGLPLNFDAWDGYPAARDRVLEAALSADADLVVLAGDSHNAWAFDLDRAGERVGVEFAGHSVTSPGFESYLGSIAPKDVAGALVGANPQLRWAETARRGYMAVELTPERATSEYRFLSDVRQRGTALAGTHRVATRPGLRRLEDA